MAYLSRGERENMLLMMVLNQTAVEWLSDDRNRLAKDEKKYMRMASTYIRKAFGMIEKRLGRQEFIDALARDAKNNTAAIVPVRATVQEDELRIKKEYFYDIADKAIAYSCQAQRDGSSRCEYRNGKKNFRKCKMYRAFIDTATPVFNPEAKGCPFEMEWFQEVSE